MKLIYIGDHGNMGRTQKKGLCLGVSVVTLRGLLPLKVNADDTASSTSQTDDAVVEPNPSESRQRDSQVAEVREQL
jgi:hypothetical protein